MTTPVHARPIAERIDWLMELSRAHSASFCSPETIWPGSATWQSTIPRSLP